MKEDWQRGKGSRGMESGVKNLRVSFRRGNWSSELVTEIHIARIKLILKESERLGGKKSIN